jgi:hypothetical protein
MWSKGKMTYSADFRKKILRIKADEGLKCPPTGRPKSPQRERLFF